MCGDVREGRGIVRLPGGLWEVEGGVRFNDRDCAGSGGGGGGVKCALCLSCGVDVFGFVKKERRDG